MLRPEFVERKLQLIADELGRLTGFRDVPHDELVADPIRLAAVERILERIVLRAIDVNEHLIASLSTGDEERTTRLNSSGSRPVTESPTSLPGAGPNRQERLAALAASQHGALTRRQLLEVGFSRAAITRRLKSGTLRALHRGVYLVGPIQPVRALEMAAVLAGGPAAALSHTSAPSILFMS